jgi:serine/threonine protein kinase
MALNPGDTLGSNHYRIVRQLARGGFDFVYLAQDTLLGEQVAIKELIPALVGDEATLKRFLAEARATMRLAHDRIVRTHNVFRESGNYYIIMEYLSGGSLEDLLKKRRSISIDETIRIAAVTCDDVTTPECDPGTLDEDTQNYSQVIATDEHGASTQGSVWQFITEGEC